jgi:hypothetical protein
MLRADPANLRWAALATATTMLCRDHQRSLKGGGHPRPGPWRSFDAVEFATSEWVDWFNNRRLPEPVGNIPTVGPRTTTALLDQPAWRRDSNQTASEKLGAVHASRGLNGLVRVTTLVCRSRLLTAVATESQSGLQELLLVRPSGLLGSTPLLGGVMGLIPKTGAIGQTAIGEQAPTIIIEPRLVVREATTLV